MVIRARAPLRLGLAGGGTDVNPYSDLYGGAVLNATISMYAFATLEPTSNCKITFHSTDTDTTFECESRPFLPLDGNLDLLKGVYNRIVRDYNNGEPLSFRLTTEVDAPRGSGLGTSSTLVVAVLGAFVEWLKLPLGEYDIAHLAYEIERIDLEFAGGKQDQYSATFGGFNFMEFYKNNRVIVNPLRIKKEYINELQFNLLLYYTGMSRLSSKIIEAQVKNVQAKKEESLNAMHRVKEQAFLMKEALLKGQLDTVGEILDYGWKFKKKMANEITTPLLEEIYETAKKAGAVGGKVSGAGGGGFMMLYTPARNRYKVMNALKKFGGEFKKYNFTKYGLETWSVNT